MSILSGYGSTGYAGSTYSGGVAAPAPPPPLPGIDEPGYVGKRFVGIDFVGGITSSDALHNITVANGVHSSSSDVVIATQITAGEDVNAPFIKWDVSGSRKYESGVDQGVLYLSDGRAIPWNGLTSIVESSNRASTSNYFDGMKIGTVVSAGDYSAVLKAVTYPDEFEELQGIGTLIDGVYLDNQPVKAFDLSYRTLVGTDADDKAGYKIHILYNVIALPKDKTYGTLTNSASLSEFEYDLSAVQEELDGYTPTSHIIIDSTQVSSDFMQAIENLLYGNLMTMPSLPDMEDLVAFLKNLSQTMGTTLISITDNGDGTWTATSTQDDLIIVNSDESFVIIDANATFTGDEYVLSDTIAD